MAEIKNKKSLSSQTQTRSLTKTSFVVPEVREGKKLLLRNMTEHKKEDYVSILLESLEEKYSKLRSDLHVSDVTMCPRQRIFREIDPVPKTKKELNLFTSGKAIHEAIQYLYLINPERFEKEKYVKYENVSGSIDIYDTWNNIPIEIKTARCSNIDQPRLVHVEQLKYYMAMSDADVGYLLYQCLSHFGEEPFKQFEITMTGEERKSKLIKLLKETNNLQKARTEKNPSIARGVYNDTEFKWLCNECPYAKQCSTIYHNQQTRGSDLESNTQHLKSKRLV